MLSNDYSIGPMSPVNYSLFGCQVNKYCRDIVKNAQHLRIQFSQLFPQSNRTKTIPSPGNRTQVNWLESSYAHHYSTDALM